ncbi:MAG: hypothetical protein B5766_00310 [Candidatus Lumbricidophila eiseniae]|uniref:ATPase BadF/BadG/BcrA/BcrD type domain-containing protein n=1 Tax=Candidatus Lumbricidiphila eiseniae TaxID=1969409 RepID=A0A2A6FV67_9MICO|nr:MAG: hypothetical protein B5766_00310 [Candidatus Lumbricidophila eiseniae]
MIFIQKGENLVSTPVEPSLLSVDLGKTNSRIRLDDANGRVERQGPGFPGFPVEDSVELALAAIIPLVAALGTDRLAGLVTIGVGAAGVDSDPVSARAFALRLREHWDAEIAIASDVLTAHLGAFAGETGTVLIAGTGAVAYSIHGGEARRSDGWGPWLGDEGSGRWAGQIGLVCALRAADGRGPATALEQDARGLGADLSADLSALPRALTGGSDVARSLASFAPTVFRRAAEGDGVASSIVDDAIAHLVATTAAITVPGTPVSVVGGLADDHEFLRRLLNELHRHRLRPHRPAGTPLDGAATLATRRDLPHERYVIRV